MRFSVSGSAQRTAGFVEDLVNRIQSEKNRIASLDARDASSGEDSSAGDVVLASPLPRPLNT